MCLVDKVQFSSKERGHWKTVPVASKRRQAYTDSATRSQSKGLELHYPSPTLVKASVGRKSLSPISGGCQGEIPHCESPTGTIIPKKKSYSGAISHQGPLPHTVNLSPKQVTHSFLLVLDYPFPFVGHNLVHRLGNTITILPKDTEISISCIPVPFNHSPVWRIAPRFFITVIN